MDLLLPAWLGALCGMIVAAVVYVPLVRIVERQLRGASDATTADERGAFEDKLSVVRRLVLAFDLAILAAAGYWIGDMLGGKTFGAQIFGVHGG